MVQKNRSVFRRWLPGLFVLSTLVITAPAQAAAYAYIHTAVYLRAGPRIGFPVVVTLLPGASVYVNGCISDYSWCDVSFGGERGWVDAAYLDYPYHGEFVPIIEYGPALGIGIFSFTISDYWGIHYRHRPWFQEREHYRSRFGVHGRVGMRPRERERERGRQWRSTSRPYPPQPRQHLRKDQRLRRTEHRAQQRAPTPRARQQNRHRTDQRHQRPGQP